MSADHDLLDRARRRARRTAWLLALVALAFYAGFMLARHWHNAQP